MGLAPTKRATPLAGVVIFFVLFCMIILRYMIQGFLTDESWTPWLLATGVFFWAAYYPAQLPIYVVALLGIIADGVAGTPFGLQAAALVSLYHVTWHQRRSLVDQAFVVCWTGFGINLAIAFVVLIVLMYILQMPLTFSLVFSYISSFLVFPLVYALMVVVESKITRSGF